MYKTPTRHKRHHGFDLYGKLENIQSSLANITDNVTDKTSDFLSHAKNQTVRAQKKVNRFIIKRPYKTLGAAVLISLFIGYLIRK